MPNIDVEMYSSLLMDCLTLPPAQCTAPFRGGVYIGPVIANRTGVDGTNTVISQPVAALCSHTSGGPRWVLV